MELMATDTGPRYMAPKLTPHQTWRQHVDGFANSLLLGAPAVPSHDAAANPSVASRIDMLL